MDSSWRVGVGPNPAYPVPALAATAPRSLPAYPGSPITRIRILGYYDNLLLAASGITPSAFAFAACHRHVPKRRVPSTVLDLILSAIRCFTAPVRCYRRRPAPASAGRVLLLAALVAAPNLSFGQAHVIAWGRNDYGQATVPAGISGAVRVTAGIRHTAVLKDDGTVVVWGGQQATVS